MCAMSDKNIVFAPRGSYREVEKGMLLMPRFDADGLIPAMVLDYRTGEPLMLAYMNEQALRMTLEIGEAVYYSRSRQEIWHKGLTSGHIQKVHHILIDCDQDALVLMVEQIGAGACHTGHHSCFFRSVPFGEQLVEGEPVALAAADDGCTFDAESVYGKK